jgi:hypothetical protein
MRANKLKTAAEAAGYAMVNPEDFAREPRPLVLRKAPRPTETGAKPEAAPAPQPARWWPSFDLFGMSGGKAPA